MPHIRWRDELSIDGGTIDEDHRHLIGIINRFMDISTKAQDTGPLLAVLHALRFYTQAHFEREEALQELANYPLSEAHAEEHAGLVDRLDNMIEAVNRSQDESIARISRETAVFLNFWLIDHIIKSDLGMKPYVAAMKPHEAVIKPLEDMAFV